MCTCTMYFYASSDQHTCIYSIIILLIHTHCILSSILLHDIHVHLPVCPSIRPSVHPSVRPSIHLSMHPSIYLPMHPCIHPSIYLSMHPYIHLCIHASMHPCIHLSMHPSIHPSISVHVYCTHDNSLSPGLIHVIVLMHSY